MPRLGVTKKKKSPHATELSQLKKEFQRVTEQLESSRAYRAADGDKRNSAGHRQLADGSATRTGRVADNAARLCDASMF